MADHLAEEIFCMGSTQKGFHTYLQRILRLPSPVYQATLDNNHSLMDWEINQWLTCKLVWFCKTRNWLVAI